MRLLETKFGRLESKVMNELRTITNLLTNKFMSIDAQTRGQLDMNSALGGTKRNNDLLGGHASSFGVDCDSNSRAELRSTPLTSPAPIAFCSDEEQDDNENNLDGATASRLSVMSSPRHRMHSVDVGSNNAYMDSLQARDSTSNEQQEPNSLLVAGATSSELPRPALLNTSI